MAEHHIFQNANIRWLILILVFAAAIRIVHARGQALWGDELFSLAIATGHSLEGDRSTWDASKGDFVAFDTPVSAVELRRSLEHTTPPASPARVARAVLISDTNPPLYYLSLWLWTLLTGTRDFLLRCHSVFWALCSIPVLWAVAKEIGNSRVAIAACALFAVLPLSVDASIEIRMYSMLWFWSLGLGWSTLTLARRGATHWIRASWIVCSVAGLLTHYFFVFPFAAFTLFLIVSPGLQSRRGLFINGLIVGILIAPWYLHLPESMAAWRITKDWLKVPQLMQETSYRALFYAFRNAFAAFGTSGLTTWTLRTVGLLLSSLFLLGLVRRTPRETLLFLALWWLLPVFGLFAVDAIQGTYTAAVPRYAFASIPPAIVLASLTADRLLGRAFVPVFAVVLLAYIPALHRLLVSTERGSWYPPAGQFLETQAASDELIIVHSIPSGALGLARYTTSAAPIVLWTQQLRRHEQRDGTEANQADLARLLNGRSRTLVVRVHDVGEPAPELRLLERQGALLRDRQLGSAHVTEFQPQTGAVFALEPTKVP